MHIQVVCLGAGQDVGRSCILVTLAGKNIMLDCGMHMGYHDERRFPDFKYISRTGRFTEALDCVIISHFHLDHCGALPYFTEMCGYDGPVFMTHPTKAICPILLEDYRKITVERKGETNFFTSEHIKCCMKKVIPVNLRQTIRVDDELEITAFYGGHVLGAAMFHIKVGLESVVYTGDYNMTADRHLGAASIDRLRPDVLITETTYATTIRDSKRCRERDFLRMVHECVQQGGKVLIPVFALGRAQELCILLETYWERMNLSFPIYFSAGLTEKANYYYKLFINWTNQKIKKTFVRRNMFNFNHIAPFDRSLIDQPGPMVLFATPGMLHAGMSLEVFKRWAGSELNMVVIPGYCVAGTVGHKLLSGWTTAVEIDKKTVIDVKMKVKYLSFSAHADAKGIMQLIRQVEPRNVVMVHGERGKMQFLKSKVSQEFGIPCHDPPNGTAVYIKTRGSLPVDVSARLLKRGRDASIQDAQEVDADSRARGLVTKRIRPLQDSVAVHGVLLWKEGETLSLLPEDEAAEGIGVRQHKLTFSVRPSTDVAKPSPDPSTVLDTLFTRLNQWLAGTVKVVRHSNCLRVRSVCLWVNEEGEVESSWDYEDEDLASRVASLITSHVTCSSDITR